MEAHMREGIDDLNKKIEESNKHANEIRIELANKLDEKFSNFDLEIQKKLSDLSSKQKSFEKTVLSNIEAVQEECKTVRGSLDKIIQDLNGRIDMVNTENVEKIDKVEKEITDNIVSLEKGISQKYQQVESNYKLITNQVNNLGVRVEKLTNEQEVMSTGITKCRSSLQSVNEQMNQVEKKLDEQVRNFKELCTREGEVSLSMCYEKNLVQFHRLPIFDPKREFIQFSF